MGRKIQNIFKVYNRNTTNRQNIKIIHTINLNTCQQPTERKSIDMPKNLSTHPISPNATKAIITNNNNNSILIYIGLVLVHAICMNISKQPKLFHLQ